jgi:hypothetical protein
MTFALTQFDGEAGQPVKIIFRIYADAKTYHFVRQTAIVAA